MQAAELQWRGNAQEAAHRRGGQAKQGSVVVTDQAAGPSGQFATGLGERKPPRRALDQAHPGPILQRRERPCHGRRRAAEAAGRAGQAAGLGNGDEDRQLLQPVHRLFHFL